MSADAWLKRLEIERAKKERMKTKEVHMNSTPTLRGKNAVVFGAGGSIGCAVAREFASEGAEVFVWPHRAKR